MKSTLILVATFSIGAALLSGCAFDLANPCPRATGATNTVTLNLADFEGVVVKNKGDVTITYGATQQVVVTAEQDILDNLDFNVVSNSLQVDVKGCWRDYDLKVEITLPRPLSEIKISGSADIVSQGIVPVKRNFDMDISGSGSINLQTDSADYVSSKISGSGSIDIIGKGNNHDIQITGSGAVRAYDFPTQDIKINTSGSGDAFVRSNGGFLDVKINGSGSVFYKGIPNSVNAVITGSGKLQKSN